jgi:hypothetical protein
MTKNPLTVRASSLYSEDVQLHRAFSGLRRNAEWRFLVYRAKKARVFH